MTLSDTETSERQDDPLVGKRLASYEVLARVARGGMGVVYRARHVYIGKIVALKVLDPQLSARPDLIDRFRTEAQSLARVEHENVVKINDILQDQGMHFIVMDFAEGINLRQYVKKHGPMPADELLSVARQTAEALFAAHREGILHRDIKPENLIMNARGRCKLADFGLAGDLRLISEGHEGPLNFGTPAYSSPEVLRRVTPDHRSDIFSYAATLHFLATGEPPFGQAGTQQILLRQKQGVQPLEKLRNDLPVKMTRVLNDCLAWHPKDRPESFREILDRLPRRAFARIGPDGATEPTGLITAEATAELPRPPRRWGIAAAMLGLAALATLAVLWWLNRQPPQDGSQAAENAAPQAPVMQSPPSNRAGPIEEIVIPTPALRPEEDAFNAAELDSRTALDRADYKTAWDAWSAFARDYPDSERTSEALRRRTAVAQRVRELRDTAMRKARDAADQALTMKRTEEALAALARFPSELLVPLGEDDPVAVADEIETQRQKVIAVEAADVARLMQRADELRREWSESRDQGRNLGESQRIRAAGNLLRERDILEAFLPGRLGDTREKLSRRLSGLRKLLESVHQDAEQLVNAWREYNDATLGEWAMWLEGELQACKPLLLKRDFTGALAHVHEVEQRLERRASEPKILHARVAALIKGSEILRTVVRQIRDEIRLGDQVHALLETELRVLRDSGAIREFVVHAEMGANGERSARLAKHTGKVVTVGNSQFSVDTESSRVTLSIAMLNVATVRRLLAAIKRPDERVAIVTWLVLQGRADEAKAELASLEALEPADNSMVDRARALVAAMSPARGEFRTLAYLAAKCGLRTAAALQAEFGDCDETRLLAAQFGVAAGSAEHARAYLEIVRRLADPELVHLATYANALAIGAPAEGDLRNRTRLEPLSAEALAALATRIRDEDSSAARTLAGNALLLDAGNEEAWAIIRQ